MKKTLMVIMMALLAVSVAFAASPTVPVEGSIENNHKTLTANLNLTNENFAGYSMGFSSTDPEIGAKTDLVVTNVENATEVQINYTDAGNAESAAPVYFYYKARSLAQVTIELKANQLKTVDEMKTLNYTITGTGVKEGSVLVDAPAKEIITPVVINDGYKAAKSDLSFSLSNLTAGDIGEYTATLTLSVTAG